MNIKLPEALNVSNHSRLYNLLLFLLLALVLLGASFIWTSDYNPLNPSISFTTGKTRSVLRFEERFIQQVLMATTPVPLSTQTQLEDQLHTLNDKELNAAWERMLNANDEADLQQKTGEFLLLLTQKARGDAPKPSPSPSASSSTSPSASSTP